MAAPKLRSLRHKVVDVAVMLHRCSSYNNAEVFQMPTSLLLCVELRCRPDLDSRLHNSNTSHTNTDKCAANTWCIAHSTWLFHIDIGFSQWEDHLAVGMLTKRSRHRAVYCQIPQR